MDYLWFSVKFALLHTAAYTVAGSVILVVSKEIYEGKGRLMDYVRDMSDEADNRYVRRRVFPAQLVRGLLMSLPLYVVLTPLAESGFVLRALFLGGLAFLYTHLASASPTPDNIEGYVYLRARYFQKSAFLKYQLEMVMYTTLFALLGSWLLFPAR